MIVKLQQLNIKTKLKVYQNSSNYYVKMKYRKQSGFFQFEKGRFAKNAQGFGKIFHEVLPLMKVLQTKTQVKSLNTNCYDLYYTAIKHLTEDGEN